MDQNLISAITDFFKRKKGHEIFLLVTGLKQSILVFLIKTKIKHYKTLDGKETQASLVLRLALKRQYNLREDGKVI